MALLQFTEVGQIITSVSEGIGIAAGIGFIILLAYIIAFHKPVCRVDTLDDNEEIIIIAESNRPVAQSLQAFKDDLDKGNIPNTGVFRLAKRGLPDVQKGSIYKVEKTETGATLVSTGRQMTIPGKRFTYA